jgi:hypothetical protein
MGGARRNGHIKPWVDGECQPPVKARVRNVVQHPVAMIQPAESPLGQRIRQRLRSLGIANQGWLAGECGVSEQAVHKWIKSGEISRKNALALAKALRCSVEWLVDGLGLSPEAYEVASDWDLVEEPYRSRWKHTIRAAADAVREREHITEIGKSRILSYAPPRRNVRHR